MSVAVMLREMNQKELCHWYAYFKLEREEYESHKTDRRNQREDARLKINQVEKREITQAEKDGLLLNQLLALSAQNSKDE